MQTIKTELLELLRRNDLLRASLIVGKVQDPNFKEEPYVERVLELAARIWHRSNRVRYDVIQKAESINHTLFKEFAIEGKSEKYKQVIDDPNRYYLHRVLEKRTGSPLSVAVLYLIMAEQIGLPCE